MNFITESPLGSGRTESCLERVLEGRDPTTRTDLLAMCELDDALQMFRLRTLPKAVVLRRYAAFWCDSCSFNH